MSFRIEIVFARWQEFVRACDVQGAAAGLDRRHHQHVQDARGLWGQVGATP